MKREIAKTNAVTKFSQAYGFLIDQQDEQMGLIFGQPGVGKSTAAKYLASQFDAVYFQVQPEMTPNAFCISLLRLLATDPAASLSRNLNKVIERFSTRQCALFLDEADYLCSDSSLLDIVRTIHDQAEVPVVLVGMTGIYNKLADKKLFIDRIQYFLEITGCSLEDTGLIASARCQVNLSDDLVKQIHQQTKGNARQIKRALSHVESFAQAHGLAEISAEQWGERSLLPANSAAPTKTRRAS